MAIAPSTTPSGCGPTGGWSSWAGRGWKSPTLPAPATPITLDCTSPPWMAARVTIEIQTVNFIALHVGAGYGGDPDWTHGQWKGANWSDAQTYDLTDPAVTDRVPWGVIDHVAHATCNGAVGSGMFEPPTSAATTRAASPTGPRSVSGRVIHRAGSFSSDMTARRHNLVGWGRRRCESPTCR